MVILVVEDERPLARHVAAALRRQGHDPHVCHDGAEGLREALSTTPDLIILDLHLPSLDGLAVLARLREARCPSRVLILTASGDVGDRVAGLRAGADDYLPKPFAVEELVARVEALGRRAATPAASERLNLADLHMELVNRRATRAGRVIDLTPREFELLHVLLSEPGRVFSRGELSERVWQRDHRYDTRTVEIFITRLRKKLDSTSDLPLLHTIRHVGYVLQTQPPADA